MPQKIIIVRHGETQYNVERRLQGSLNIPLNQNGVAQSLQVADRLSSESVTAIYTSDNKRAYVTALHIAKRFALKPNRRRALREDNMGVLEGWAWETEADQYKQQLWHERIKAREAGDKFWKRHGGESLYKFTLRVKLFLQTIERKHPQGTIIIVSHAGTINRILEIYGLKKPSEQHIRFKNTSVTVLIKNGNKYDLVVNNDISHL